jgi:hypothetical protein
MPPNVLSKYGFECAIVWLIVRCENVATKYNIGERLLKLNA